MIKQRRTFKTPCCGKKTQLVFPYGQLAHHCLCEYCGGQYRIFYSKKRSGRKDYEGDMAHRMIKKVAIDKEIEIKRNKKQKKKKCSKDHEELAKIMGNHYCPECGEFL